MIVFIVVILAMIGVFSLRLYKTQAAVTEDSLVAADADSMEYQSTVEAARGNILDRNGNVLVSNRASYNLVIINFVFFNAPDPNGNLLKVLNLCDELGIAYESHFPVSAERPYTYTDTDDTAWQGYFRSFLASRSYDLDISAPTLMKRLRDEYKIPDDWTQQDVYRVISVRYELELRSVDEIGMENYMLAEDVDAESLAAVMELAVPGVVVENGTVREYNTTYAAHILGYIGPIWSEEAAEYREKGYSMNALVGKSGVEQAFEEYLHGSSGIKRTTVSSTGEILNRYYVTEPVPGNNVELTIDISLQAVAEQALEKVILDLRENGVGRNKEGKDARGGAVVVQMCKTGEILAMASYPTYDLATRAENAVALNEDETAPMFNRALAAYPPGSVYKMVTAIAAVDMGGFDPGYIIEDKGLYTFYESFQPKCHIWSLANPRTHGKINLMQAIAYSCNYYFYEVGRLTYNSYMEKTGENPFDIVAKALGLGDEKYRYHDHEKLAHYANAATDIEFQMPFGFKEVEGIHSRTNFDLSQHEKFSGKKIQYFDPELNESYIPYVIETSIGVDRMFLSVLCSSYEEQTLEGGETRVVLHLPEALAPVKCAVMPLVRKDGLPEKAREIVNDLKFDFNTHYEEKDSIGKRYRRQDAIGTPFCITVDHQTLEDNTVTLRERDSMEQKRVAISDLHTLIHDRVSLNSLLRKLG